MSDPVERGQLQIVRDHTSNSVATYDVPAVSDRPRLVPPGSTLPANTPSTPPNPPARSQDWPWDFLKRLNRTGHSGWLVTTLVLILVVAMSLSFGFVRGWLDAKSTLTASVVFLVLLFGAMLVAHWPSRNPH